MRVKVLLVLICGFGIAGLMPMDSEVQARGKPKLRAEVAELRGRLAKLEQDLATYTRREATAGGGVVVPQPGSGLCGDPCATDSDGDGVGDCEDLCPCDPSKADSDGDSVPDCADPCPDDATDACIDPCRMDSDGDGINDCKDPCPWDPNEAVDGDADGIPDCADPCPEDPTNQCTGLCTLDADGDGQPDCIDICPWGANSTQPCFYPASEAKWPAFTLRR